MEIAFSTLLIVFFLMPGAICVNTVFSDPRGKYTLSSPFEFIYKSLLPAVLFHSTAILLTIAIFKLNLSLLNQILESEGYRIFLQKQFILLSIFYILIVFFISYLFSIMLRSVIFRFRLDLMYDIFKFHNDFFYIIYGDRPLNKKSRILHTIVSLELKSCPNKIFEGRLLDYNYSKDGLNYIIIRVDTIILNGKRQKKIDSYYKTYFDFENIQNISFSYVIEKTDT